MIFTYCNLAKMLDYKNGVPNLNEVSFRRPDLQINSYKRRFIGGKGFEYTGKTYKKT